MSIPAPSRTTAIEKLRAVLAQTSPTSSWPEGREAADILSFKQEVIGRFGAAFHPSRVRRLTAEQFRSFLPFNGNRHWVSLQRHGPKS
jgi:hypothetical protein